MAKTVNLRIKQNFTDKETNVDYKKGKIYPFSEKRAEELLKNPYIVEKVSVAETEDKTENKTEDTEK